MLKCSYVFPRLLGSWGKRVVCFFGNDTEGTLCTKSVETRNRGNSFRMIVTISLL